ncbi:hypothetical protein BH09CHL1_BH09CHL1_16600 [soil metagenome]
MRKFIVGIGLIATIGVGAGFGANNLTTAQDLTATPGQLLVCGTPLASPDASPGASATPLIIIDSTPMSGVGAVIASPGAVSSGTCTTQPGA